MCRRFLTTLGSARPSGTARLALQSANPRLELRAVSNISTGLRAASSAAHAETPRDTSLPEHAEVVIVGGGVIGCSVAYNLALQGVTDVVRC